MTNTPFFEEKVVKSVRTSYMFSHWEINPFSSFEMPNPPYPNYEGWFKNNKNGNSKYSNGFVDFNYKACTNDVKSGWKYKWLHGSSEYSSNVINDKFQKPKEFGRSNWSFQDCDKASDNLGKNTHRFFNTRDGSEADGFRCIDRKDCNLSRKYYWGILDSHKFTDGYVTYDHGKNAKANYIRAKGITFRYECYFEETTESLGEANDKHGLIPMQFAAMAFIKPDDDYVYLAELIGVGSAWSESSADSDLCKDTLYRSGHRQNIGNIWHESDWNVMWEKNSNGEQGTVKGGGPWDEFGPYAHEHYYAPVYYNAQPPSKYKRRNKWPRNVTGQATLTLSKNSVRKIWDNNMVCVGIIVGSCNTSRKSGFVGSTMQFRMFDVRLQEMRDRDDNHIEHRKNIETGSLYSQLLAKPMKAKDAMEFYKKQKEGETPLYRELDRI